MFKAYQILGIFLLVTSLTWAAPFMEQGNELYKKGEFKKAFFKYKKALNSGENKSMAKFNMANSLYQMKQGKEVEVKMPSRPDPKVDSDTERPGKKIETFFPGHLLINL